MTMAAGSEITRLLVGAPGLDPEPVDLADDEIVLLGRIPEAGQVPHDPELPAGPPRARVILAPSVSTNHALAWSSNGQVSVRDLSSRNGTWVRVSRGGTVRFPLGTDVHVRLASSVDAPAREQAPPPVQYRSGNDFGANLAKAVADWLQRLGSPARVWASPATAANERPGIAPLRLASGEMLFVQLERTVDERFHEGMAQVCRYVTAQNALFAAEQRARDDGLILASSAIRLVHRRIVELATQGLPSLVLLGASGTGKERLARAYHRHLGRNGDLVAINCATLGRDRVAVDLFGAEKGSYTGAQRTMLGAVERADGGTLFLDEVGEMPLDVQPQLLRFLETGEYQRLGALGAPRFADVRVVAATNRDLRRMTREGAFREDLFFRLALEIIQVPPLSDRFEDVTTYMQTQMLGTVSAYDALQPAALALLKHHAWTGNFRELVNLIRRLPRSSEAGALDSEAIRRALEAGALLPVQGPSASPVAGEPADGGWLECVTASARAFIEDADQPFPATWNEVTTFIEQYLKPLALARMAKVTGAQGLADVSVMRIAERLKADRGTVLKQLRRYLERFKDRQPDR